MTHYLSLSKAFGFCFEQAISARAHHPYVEQIPPIPGKIHTPLPPPVMQTFEEPDRPVPGDTDFSVDEVVLAFHGSLLYEATVLSVEIEPGKRATSYTVHFQGYKKSWDETVSSDRVFPHNDINLRIAHRLLNGAKMRQQALQPASTEKEEQMKDASTSPSAPVHALFQIPPHLQRQAVDDWEMVTKEAKLVPLPREVSVQDVLHKWVNTRRQSTDKATREVAEGLQTYFDTCLPKMLLYRVERKQYNQLFSTGTPRDETLLPSAVYGPEHLLRLLIKLPYILEGSDVPEETMEVIAEKVNELCKYMLKNGRLLFLAEYEDAPSQYLDGVAQQS